MASGLILLNHFQVNPYERDGFQRLPDVLPVQTQAVLQDPQMCSSKVLVPKDPPPDAMQQPSTSQALDLFQETTSLPDKNNIESDVSLLVASLVASVEASNLPIENNQRTVSLLLDSLVASVEADINSKNRSTFHEILTNVSP